MKGIIAIISCLITIQTMAKVSVTLNRDGSVSKKEITLNNKSMTSLSSDSEKGFVGFNKILSTDKRVFGDYIRDRIYDTSEAPFRTIGQMEL